MRSMCLKHNSKAMYMCKRVQSDNRAHCSTAHCSIAMYKFCENTVVTIHHIALRPAINACACFVTTCCRYVQAPKQSMYIYIYRPSFMRQRLAY